MEPLVRGDDLLLVQLLDILALNLRNLLTQGIILESPEQIASTQDKIDKTRQQLDRLRSILRKSKESERRRRQFAKSGS
jgi:uncharacterized coiled-coil protein SlyX